jgi:hypothetical protein
LSLSSERNTKTTIIMITQTVGNALNCYSLQGSIITNFQVLKIASILVLSLIIITV